MSVSRTLTRMALALLLGGLLATPALATPLNLQSGDVVDTIEFDALRSNGDQGSYTWDGLLGTIESDPDARITSVDVERAPAYPPTLTSVPETNVTFTFRADLLNYQQTGPTSANVFFTSAAPRTGGFDVNVFQGALGSILTGNFVGNFVFGGDFTQPSLLATANIIVTGGDSQLINALGGIGGMAVLELTASAFNFMPNLSTLGADGNLVNSNFTLEFSGVIRPAATAPFVPEPSVAMLLGCVLLGGLGFARRARAR
jgi:hypothetical protein